MKTIAKISVFCFCVLGLSSPAFALVQSTFKDFEKFGLTAGGILEWLTSPLFLPNKKNERQEVDNKLSSKYFESVGRHMLQLKKSCVFINEATAGGNSAAVYNIFIAEACEPGQTPDDFRLRFVLKLLPETYHARAAHVPQEISNLETLKSSSEYTLLSLIDSRRPIVTQLVQAYSFIHKPTKDSSTHSKRFFVILEAAQGLSLYDIFTSQTIDDNTKLNAFNKFGEALAIFHQGKMPSQNMFGAYYRQRYRQDATIADIDFPQSWLHHYKSSSVHRDLHLRNVFYDGNRIYFIDNETLTQSLRRPVSITIDIGHVLLTPLIYWNYFDKCLRGINLVDDAAEQYVSNIREWEHCRTMMDMFRVFFRGYISAYPREEQPYLAKFLSVLLKSGFNSLIISTGQAVPSQVYKSTDDWGTTFSSNSKLGSSPPRTIDRPNEKFIISLGEYLERLAHSLDQSKTQP